MLRNKNNRPQAAPAWLKWVLIAFIGYAGFLHFTDRGEKAATQTASMAASGLTAGGVQYTPVNNGVRVGGDIPGAGEEALCGQLAEVKVNGRYPDGSLIAPADGQKELRLNVGAATEEFPWAPGIVGMKVGGVREVLLNASVLPEETRKAKALEDNAGLQYRIELLSLTPNVPTGTLSFRAMALNEGTGEEARCGDKVKIHLVLWGPDGTMLYSSMRDNHQSPLPITLGGSEIFYGIDRGVLGMRTGGGRSLVIPPAYLQTSGGDTYKILEKLPGDAIVLADVTLVEKARR